MADSQQFCRICRGEGTPDQPLLHPCKCRGSIKYIHQDCLMEWLKHSNKSTKQCDICNTPYRFKTIYDPNMPDRIPTSFIWDKFKMSMTRSFIRSVSITLYVVCLFIQVPLFWKFIGRLYTWAIDGKLPYNNSNFFEALLFGEYDIYQYEHVNDPIKFKLFKIRKFFDYTHFSGIRYISVFLIIHLALFVEHEWVVRDEGYAKLLLRKIGKEPKSKLVDMFQNALHGLRNDAQNGNQDADDVVNRIEMIANAINDLQEPQNDRARELELMANLRDNAARLNERQEPEQQEQEQDEEEEGTREGAREGVRDVTGDDNDNDNDSDSDSENDEASQLHREALNNLNQPEPNDDINHHPQQHVEPQLDGDEPIRGVQHPAFDGAIFDHPIENPDIDPEAQEQFDNLIDQVGANENGNGDDNVINIGPFQPDQGQEQAQNQDLANADLENENGNILEALGLNLNVTTPIFLMVMCNIILTIYLFLAYLIPQVIGTMITSVMGFSVSITTKLFFISKITDKFPIDTWKRTLFTPDGYFVKTDRPFIDFLLFTLSDIVLLPTQRTLYHLLVLDPETFKNHQPTLIERLITLSLGYSFIGVVIWQFMRMLLRGGKPIKGSARRVYKILFEFTSTIKVFVIFAIEIFFFPVYCGWLLDFCAAPILLDSFKVNDTSSVNTGKIRYLLLFTSSSDLLTVNYIRIALYWAFGTLYMLFFALFVGMIRSKILRPGVLFFIRSPDDPNARLIHDALVKPFMLQISRIYLSGKVYTAFILIGIGGITWGLRYLLHKDQVILPLAIYGNFAVVSCIFTIFTLSSSKQLLSKYCEKYWRKGFEISCHKLRLSHFILGRPFPQERGYLIYRNWKEQFKGTAVPDYSNPVTPREAQKIFKENPEVNCCFVPDGNYVRVPDNDTVSRKYVKKLFVPVTKDDRLLSSNDTNNTENFFGDEEDQEESSDEEFNNENNHTVVYRPPNFKLRCFELIIMLWIFSIILILLIIFTGLLIGRPFVQLLIVFDRLPAGILNAGTTGSFEWSNIANNWKLAIENYDWKLADVWSLSMGIYVELMILKRYDRKQEDGSNEVEHEVDGNRNGNNNNNNEAQQQGQQGQQGQQEQQQQPANQNGAIRGAIFNVGNLNRVVFGNLTVLQLISMASLVFLDGFCWVLWTAYVHNFAVDFPLVAYNNGWGLGKHVNYREVVEKQSTSSWSFVCLHLLASFWTAFPFIKSFIGIILGHYQNRNDQDRNGANQQIEGQNELIVFKLFKSLKLKTNLIRIISLWAFIWAYSIKNLKSAYGIIIFAFGETEFELSLYLGLGAICLMFIVIDIVNRAHKSLKEYVVQVKNERYVRGRALENMDE